MIRNIMIENSTNSIC